MDRQLIVWLHIIKAIQKAGNYNITIWDGQDGKRDFGIDARLIIHDSRYEMDAENTCSFRRSPLGLRRSNSFSLTQTKYTSRPIIQHMFQGQI